MKPATPDTRLSVTRSLSWWEGYYSCKLGLHKRKNPYLEDAKLDDGYDYLEWREGWEHAFFGEDPNCI